VWRDEHVARFYRCELIQESNVEEAGRIRASLKQALDIGLADTGAGAPISTQFPDQTN
jgi:hypothetical protein